MLTIARNITKHNKAKEELRESEARYKAIFESTGTATLIVDEDTTILMANDECFEMFGYDTASLIEKKWTQFVAPESLEEMLKNHQLRRQSPELVPSRYEVKLLNSKDEKRVVILNVKMIPGTKHSVVSMMDITNRKKVENELRESKSNLEQYFENDISANYVVSHSGEIFSCNKTFLGLFGFEKKSDTEKFNITDLYKNPEDREHIIRQIKQVGKVEDYEVEFIANDGKTIHVLINAIGIFGKVGKLEKIRGYVVDITEQKNIERELVKFKLSIERSSEAIFMTDIDGHIIFVNPAFEKLYGYTSEECMGKTPRILKSGTLQDNVYKKFWNTLLSKDAVSGEITNKTKDGSLLTIDGYNTSILDATGEISGFIGIHRDITTLKKQEDALKQSEEKYRRFFENDITGNYRTSIDGKILMCNEAFIKILKYKNKEEIIGINTSDLYFENSDRENFLNKVRAEKKLQNNELTLKACDGSKVEIIENIIGIFDDSGELKEINGYMFDITERKRAQFEYQTMIKTSKDGFWIINANTGKFIDVNQAYCQMIGYSREELMQMTIRDVEAVETQEETKQHIALIIEKGFDSFETKHKTKSGKIIDIEASVTYVTESTEQFFVFVKDVTERKQIENEALRLSHATEQSPASIIIADLQGNMEYVNPKLLEISGYTKEELIGQNPRIFNSGEKSKEEYQELWNTISSGRHWTGQFHNKKKNGELYWESASISPIINEKQEIINYVAVKEDITERKKLENIQKTLINISDAIITSPNLNFFSEIIFNELTKIINTQNFYIALYNEQEQVFSTIFIFDKLDDSLTEFPAEKTLSGYVVRKRESQFVDEQNFEKLADIGEIELIGPPSEVWIGVPIFENEKAIGVLVIQSYKGEKKLTKDDLRILEYVAPSIGLAIERKKIIENLKIAKEEAEESDRLKSAFLANMSHEIRTPMNGILGFTELLIEPDLSSKQKEKYIEIVHESGQRMLNTVNDIIEISRIEADEVNIKLKETDLNSSFEELIRFFKLEAEKKGLKLILELLLPAEKKNLTTDRNKFESILSNLIKNAIKYTESGTITVGCRFLNNTTIECYVKDTGIGIPKHRQKAIFDRFMQADTADTRLFEGSGLGLAIAKSYIEMLGGNIWVKSREGKGSTFYFNLPFNKFVTEKKSVVNNRPNNEKKNKLLQTKRDLRILITEDDKTSLSYLSHIVKDFCIEILHAETGNEAIELCRNTKDLDLVLMDIQLPDLNGYEATRRIREFNKDVIIIAQTAYAISGDSEKAIEAGCNAYISKPIKKRLLLEKIQKHLDSQV